MNVVIEPQVWLHALAGGALIGLAATLLLLFNGRLAGVSGIFGSLMLDRAPGGDRVWRALFLLGLVAGALLYAQVGDAPVPGVGVLGWAGVLAGGLLVGFGTRLGTGCTSGHGICGLARFSRRSAAATLCFMVFGFLTVFVLRHLWRIA
ncbi:MAG: YeeE/YedE thiosulfate transporter family protein [Nevskia sp.]